MTTFERLQRAGVPVAYDDAGPAAPDLRDRIRAAFGALLADSGPWEPHGFVSIRRLRERLPRIPRRDLDAALVRMYEDQEVNLIPQSNQAKLTEADRAAAVRCGGQDKHLFSFPGRSRAALHKTSPADKAGERYPRPARLADRSYLFGLHFHGDLAMPAPEVVQAEGDPCRCQPGR